jgi:hypothetical protein
LPSYLLCYTGCSSFGAGRAKSVLSGADSAAGSIGGGASGGGVTLPTVSNVQFQTHHNHKFQILYKVLHKHEITNQ